MQNGKACLGDIIYRYITADQFSPECLLDCLDLSTEHHTLDIANRIEAAIHVWRLKDHKKHLSSAKSRRSWGGKVKGLVADGEKNKNNFLAQRAETLLESLKHRFPGLPQTALDMAKIQYNKVCYFPPESLVWIELIICSVHVQDVATAWNIWFLARPLCQGIGYVEYFIYMI